MPEWINVARDFAGPFATVLASCVAAYFARAQVQVAKTQTNIANDKLKFDLYERRYAIYKATKDLIEYVRLNCNGYTDPNIIRSMYIKLDESRFFFDCDIRKVLDEVHDECENLLKAIEERRHGAVRWEGTAENVVRPQQKLNALYGSLPEAFEKALAFRHLIERDR